VTLLGWDEHGVWLGGRDGTPVQRGSEPPIASPPFALLVAEDKWWTAVWNLEHPASPFSYDVYADVCTPPEWEGKHVTLVDLDLDVVRRHDGQCSIEDTDEFESHSLAFGYPPGVRDSAVASAGHLLAELEAFREPFGGVGKDWLRRVVGAP
jgi:protein associated with RNAse G/E